MELKEQLRKNVENATVRIVDYKHDYIGLGVLIPGACILTTAACVHNMLSVNDCHLCETKSESEEETIGEIETKGIAHLNVQLRELVLDANIAVLSAPDARIIPEEKARPSEEFCKTTEAVSLFSGEMDTKPFHVHILNQDGSWIAGAAAQHESRSTSYSLHLESLDSDIGMGSQGAPVVNDKGELVGIISENSESARIIYPPLALPGYLWKRLMAASK